MMGLYMDGHLQTKGLYSISITFAKYACHLIQMRGLISFFAPIWTEVSYSKKTVRRKGSEGSYSSLSRRQSEVFYIFIYTIKHFLQQCLSYPLNKVS